VEESSALGYTALPAMLPLPDLPESPHDAHEYRFLAQAYLAAHAYEKALEFAEAGLAAMPHDWALIAIRGDARSGLWDEEGASADWQLALELRRDEIPEPSDL
jgi:tetratricopeptide (TPR) repeat protein